MKILSSEDLRLCAVDTVLRRHEAFVAAAAGDLRGDAVACALLCDWFAIADGSSVELDSPAALAGAVWRMGGRALPLFLLEGMHLGATDAVGRGLCDALVPRGDDPLKWAREWAGGRSGLALDSAAALTRLRGGDALERAEFARLFAAGEPQAGLAAFLGKRRPDF